MTKKKTYDIFRAFDGKTTTIHLDNIVGIRRHNEYMYLGNPRYSVYTDLNHSAGYALVPIIDGHYNVSYMDSAEILGILHYLGKMTTTTVENLFNDYTRKGDTFHYKNDTTS